MPAIQPSYFGEWGKQAATSYLTKGSGLNKEIAKVAVANDLNPAQIKRVCEVANLATYNSLFPSNRDKALDFDIATPEKVASELENLSVERPHLDYKTTPQMKKKASDDQINAIFGVRSISNEPDVHERVKVAERFGRQVNDVKQELRYRMYENTVEKQAAERDIYYAVEQMVLSGEDFNKIASVVMNYSKHDIKPLMIDTYRKLRDEGVFGVHEKLAQGDPTNVIDQAMESDKLSPVGKNTVVVNNRHPLMQAVDTLGDKLDSEDKLRRATWMMDNSANVIKGKIEDISGSMQRDDYVKNMLNEDDSPTKSYQSAVHTPG